VANLAKGEKRTLKVREAVVHPPAKTRALSEENNQCEKGDDSREAPKKASNGGTTEDNASWGGG